MIEFHLSQGYSRDHVINDIDDNVIPRVSELLLLRNALFAKLVAKSIATKILTAKSESFPPLRTPAEQPGASWLLPSLSLFISLSLTPSQLSLFSLCTWLQRTFRNKDNARTAPGNEKGNDITQRATEHTRHASTNGVVREGG